MNYYIDTELLLDNNFTIFSDKNYKLSAVLVDGVFNKKFNEDFLKNFEDFQLYNNGEFNLKLATWLANNLHYYF